MLCGYAQYGGRNMKQYKVGLWYTEYGSVIVNARSAKQAEKIVADHLGDVGIYEANESSYSCNDRDYGSQDAEVISSEKI